MEGVLPSACGRPISREGGFLRPFFGGCVASDEPVTSG